MRLLLALAHHTLVSPVANIGCRRTLRRASQWRFCKPLYLRPFEPYKHANEPVRETARIHHPLTLGPGFNVLRRWV